MTGGHLGLLAYWFLSAGLFISVIIERLPKETLPMVRCGRNPWRHLYHDVFILPSLPVVHSLVPTCTRHLLTDYQLCVSTRKVQDDVLFMCPDRTDKDAEGPDSCFVSFEGSRTVTLNLS